MPSREFRSSSRGTHGRRSDFWINDGCLGTRRWDFGGSASLIWQDFREQFFFKIHVFCFFSFFSLCLFAVPFFFWRSWSFWGDWHTIPFTHSFHNHKSETQLQDIGRSENRKLINLLFSENLFHFSESSIWSRCCRSAAWQINVLEPGNTSPSVPQFSPKKDHCDFATKCLRYLSRLHLSKWSLLFFFAPWPALKLDDI